MNTFKLLLLEDNPADADLLQEMLTETNQIDWQITWVEYLSDAVRKAKECQFDVVLSDLSLPDAYGLDTVIQLHALVPDLPIVVLTVFEDEAQGLEAIRQGAEDYLTKGKINYSLLTRTIRYAIERADTRRVMRQQSAAMAACGEGIAILNQSQEHIYLNQAYARIYGYDDSAELIGKTWTILYERQEQERLEQHILLTIQHRKHWYGEAIGKHRDGKQFDQELSITALKEGGFVCTVRDITDRKQADLALRRSQQELRDFVENASVGLHWVDPEGTVLWANQWGLDLLGYSREEYIGQPIAKFHADPEVLEDILQRLDRNESLQGYEARLQCKDGSIRYVSINSNAYWEDGTFIHTRCFFHDITDRKQAEEVLRESELRFRTLADTAPVLIWMSSDDSLCTYLNQGWLDFTGRTLEQGIGDGWLESLHPDDVQRCLEASEAAKAVYQGYVIEYRLRRFDGEYRWILEVRVPRFTSDNRFLGYIGSCIDISDRKQVEVEISKALARERELNQLKSSFVSMVSHEFRTPMTTIRTATELLQYYNQKLTDEKRNKYFGQIYTSISQMLHLLDEMLLLGKTEVGGLQYEPASLDLKSFCEEITEIFQLNAGNLHHIDFTCQGECTDADMDEVLLRHIFTNLLSNAIKYSPKGGGIQFNLLCRNHIAIFQVIDSGIGIPTKDQQHLFETFHRASNVGKIEGTGLGLAIVKNCIDLHRGHIQVESKVGVGTTFTVSLPLKSLR